MRFEYNVEVKTILGMQYGYNGLGAQRSTAFLGFGVGRSVQRGARIPTSFPRCSPGHPKMNGERRSSLRA